ncbi:hypothetical protein [Actinoplanes sp. NPDC049599]|uniref:hypothetical protein n=1 Tax=Actinoplanes sp. NPDC049599 TaxID=3363903 RepID=UPI0037AA1B18
MDRLRPPTAWPGLVRWLTVALVLAGLGLLRCGHCDASPAAQHPGSTAAAITAAAADRDHDDHDDHDDHGGGPAVSDSCHLLPLTGPAAPTVAALRTEPSMRAVAVVAAQRLVLPSGRSMPPVALDALGVSRT